MVCAKQVKEGILMRIILAFIIFIVALIVFFAWQHRYFSPRSFSELAEERKRLKEAARKHIAATASHDGDA